MANHKNYPMSAKPAPCPHFCYLIQHLPAGQILRIARCSCRIKTKIEWKKVELITGNFLSFMVKFARRVAVRQLIVLEHLCRINGYTLGSSL